MSGSSCANPLGFSVLVDYWLAELTPAEEERIEEHLLGCTTCSERLRDLIGLAGGIQTLARSGTVRTIVTSAFLERLALEGLRVREYRVAPGGSVECTVTADDDLVVARLVAELHGVSRVDLAKCDAAGKEKERLHDIPVSPSAEEVVLLERIDKLRALPAGVDRLKLVAVEEHGERLLGEYTFIHTPSGQS